MDPLESPISNLGAQASLHLWRRKQNIRELAEKDLGQVASSRECRLKPKQKTGSIANDD
jgi:hypothetical protein